MFDLPGRDAGHLKELLQQGDIRPVAFFNQAT